MKEILKYLMGKSNLITKLIKQPIRCQYYSDYRHHSLNNFPNFPYANLQVQKQIQRGMKLNYFQHRSLWNTLNKVHFGNYAVISKPANVSEPLSVPCHIIRPSYADTGEPNASPKYPERKSDCQVEGMREACQIVRVVLNEVSKHIKVGITNDDIDSIVHKKATECGSYPSPLNYHGFPKSCCTSVNNIACHGIPDDRALQNGDIISVDVTVFYKGYHGDCCETFLVGDVDEAGKHLVSAAKKCRDNAISICGPGVPFAAIGCEVEKVAYSEGITIVPAFIGHGIGTYFHGPPDIYHCYNNYPGVMEPGMTFTVEPIVAQGSREAMILEDGWTVVMLDNGRAAQFEHTILITDIGHEILTKYGPPIL